jgi:hypothetical protein
MMITTSKKYEILRSTEGKTRRARTSHEMYRKFGTAGKK